jgi:putative Holliday junction resolvase
VIAIGVDPGARRIGIAVSDAHGRLARPLTLIECQSLAADVARVRELVDSRGAARVVVGRPVTLSGSVGPAARRARRFANALRRAVEVEVVLWDERLTTVQAERRLRAAGRRSARRRALRDAAAAAVMLQSYLDSRPEDGQA